MENQRPQAPYLPDNLEFVAKNNAFTADQLKHNMLNGELMAVVIGFFCGNTVSLPVDPRSRMSTPKTNPSRVFTPEGTFGWGGSCASIYPVDSPGGYQVHYSCTSKTEDVANTEPIVAWQDCSVLRLSRVQVRLLHRQAVALSRLRSFELLSSNRR
jgi:allophanate hydrolase subunit 1